MHIIFKSNSRCQFKVKIPNSNSRYQLEVFPLRVCKHSHVFAVIRENHKSHYTNKSLKATLVVNQGYSRIESTSTLSCLCRDRQRSHK